MKSKLFLIHGYNGDTLDTFGAYVKREAEARGFEVIVPLFPVREEASYQSWSEVFKKFESQIDEHSIIVAHSLATLFIPRFLAEHDLSAGVYISVAGFLEDHSGREDLQKVVDNFQPSAAEIEKAVGVMKYRYALYSDNDHLNPQNVLEEYADRFKATRVFIPNAGHMGRKSGIKELPQIIEIMDRHLR